MRIYGITHFNPFGMTFYDLEKYVMTFHDLFDLKKFPRFSWPPFDPEIVSRSFVTLKNHSMTFVTPNLM